MNDALVDVFTLGRLVVYREIDVPDVDVHVPRLSAAVEAVCAAHPRAAAHLHVVDLQLSFQRFAPRQREAFTRLARRFDGRLAAAGFVVPSEGFAGSVARSVITGILLAVHAQTPTHLAASVEGAVSWLGRGDPALPTPEAVSAVLAELERRRPGQRSARR